MQCDDLLTFRQFSKKGADDAIDVSYFPPCLPNVTFAYVGLQYDADVGRATGAGEVQEDFISNLSRISQLTGSFLRQRIIVR